MRTGLRFSLEGLADRLHKRTGTPCHDSNNSNMDIRFEVHCTAPVGREYHSIVLKDGAYLACMTRLARLTLNSVRRDSVTRVRHRCRTDTATSRVDPVFDVSMHPNLMFLLCC